MAKLTIYIYIYSAVVGVVSVIDLELRLSRVGRLCRLQFYSICNVNVLLILGVQRFHPMEMEELSGILVSAVCDDSFFREMRDGLRAKDSLVQFSTTFLRGLHEMETMEGLQLEAFRNETQVTGTIIESLHRVGKVCKCMLHVFCVDPPNGIITKDEDVTQLSQYNGRQMFESTIKATLIDKACWWSSEVTDLVQKASSAALLGGKVETLESNLENDGSDLASALELMKEVQAATRRQKLESIRQKFMERFKRTSVGIRGGSSNHQHNSRSIDAVLEGLALVGDLPGSSDEKRALQTWRTSQIPILAANDMKIMFQEKTGAVDFDRIQVCIKHYGSEKKLDSDMSEALCGFLPIALRAVMDKARLTKENLYSYSNLFT